MVLGFCVSQKAHFDGTAIANFNKLVFKVFLPANMFSAVYFSDISKVLDPRLISYGAGGILTVYLLAYFFVVRLVRDDRKRGAIIQIIYRSNFVILGVPLVENIYGPEAVNMPLMLVTIIPPLYNVLAVFTLEKFRGGRMDWQHVLRGVVTNPMILGALIGGLVKLLPFPLPEFLAKALKEMAVGTTPLSLIVLGASFNFKSAVGEFRTLLVCIFSRLVLAPAVFFGWCCSLWFQRARTGHSYVCHHYSLCGGQLYHGPADGQRWRTDRELCGLHFCLVLCDHVPLDLLCENPGTDLIQ